MEDFGAFVRRELEKREISQRTMAKDLNISAPYLSDILNNHRNAPVQKQKIFNYLNSKPVKSQKEAVKHGQR
ncbi:helix-turn-helix transcriptional regulator [Staphylococcus saprophyticus]|nr:helix-turn-helix transcriptional regulator [Staphylococcus saprophyticus]